MNKAVTPPSQAAVPAPSHVAWQGDGWTIALSVEGNVVAKADLKWADASCDAEFLKTLNACLIGMTLRQARDHGVQHACLKSHIQGHAAKVPGIVMPANYSPTSRAAAKALRKAIDSMLPPDITNWNFDDNGFSEAWHKLSPETRRQRIEVLIAEFLKKDGKADAAVVTEVDEYDRVFMQFADDFPLSDKPPMLMHIERYVRNATGERIELFMSEMKDNNRIRRL